MKYIYALRFFLATLLTPRPFRDEQWQQWLGKNERLRTSIDAALHELGVPDEHYAAPVANAIEILRAASARGGTIPETLNDPVDTPGLTQPSPMAVDN